jgi:hypothetical protein
MTNEKAKQIKEIKRVLIQTCKRVRTFQEDYMQDRYAEAIYAAGYRRQTERDVAEALDRLTPKKPIETEDGFGDRELCCPHCIGPVTNYWVHGTVPKHCQFCGQALDWEGAKT